MLDWYPRYKRDLPWRDTKNPYIIWLSEIILQQTRVAQGLPYFEKFLTHYPALEDFAAAPLDEILRHWQGLGYYSRARNMHHCAIQIQQDHRGEFPGTYAGLLRLKGIGTYTAAAIASFAFGEAVAVVDGNVFRVMSRFFGMEEDINSTVGKRKFQQLANDLVPKKHPGEYNQAVMEFGALQCVPINPDCGSCTLSAGCFAFKHGVVSGLPVKVNKTKIKQRNFVYLHIECGDYIVAKQRGEGDIWQGLYDFPLEEVSSDIAEGEFKPVKYQRLLKLGSLIVGESPAKYRHVLTHQRIFATFVKFMVPAGNLPALTDWVADSGFQLLTIDQLEKLGKPRLLLKYLNGEK